MPKHRSLAALALLALLVVSPAHARKDTGNKKVGALELHKELQRDPLLVLGLWLDQPTTGFQGLAGLLERFSPDAAASAGSGLDTEWTAALRAQLLPRLGSEVALVVDLPPIDEAVAALQLSQDEALSTFLGRVGLVARVKDEAGVEQAFRQWILAAGGELAMADGMTEASVPVGIAQQQEGPTHMRLFYAFDAQRWALGFSADWVRAALEARPKGERLVDGEDFKTVFSQLDSKPTDLVYVNLPRLRTLVSDSQVVRMVLRSNEELREFFDRFFTDETMGVGMGSTSVRLPGGVKTTNFGPSWMAGPAVSGGYMAALALPTVLTTVDRGRTEQTVSDLQAIASACEGFSTDSRVYPGPTEGWVPVDRIAAYLEPVYIGQLPRTDGWRNPILYWSDGRTYRILSRGRDGEADRDWTLPVKDGAFAGVDSDIVFGDGQMLAGPVTPGGE